LKTWRSAALVGACVTLLAACGGSRGADVAAPPALAVPPPAAEAPPPGEPPAATATLAAIAPSAGLRTPDLIGLSRAELARLLGAPTLLRREPPGEVWQYAGNACVLHVFLYAEPNGSRVAHYESVQRAGRRLTARDCYARLLAEPRSEGAS